MKKSTESCLLEALRRYHSFHPDKSPLQAWTGLGTMSTYESAVKEGYMAPVSTIAPRTMGWFRLTEKGLGAVLSLANRGYRVKDYNVEKAQS